MAWKDSEAKDMAEKMLIKGQSIKEVMAVMEGRCEIYNVYDLKKNLTLAGKLPGVGAANPNEPASHRIKRTIDELKGKRKGGKKEDVVSPTPAFLVQLIAEGERLRRRIDAIDALLATYDDLIPLPDSLK